MMREQHSLRNLRTRHRVLNSKWADLCDSYLPISPPGSIWRYSRAELPADPAQGWKLHIAATVLSAVQVMEAVAPLLTERRVLFKGPRSLGELDELNRGVIYGYSQVGKFLTVYPQTTEEAVSLARELNRLTREISCPDVPFDLKYGNRGCVYYRYGAFKTMEVEVANGERVKALRDPQGKLVPDVRDADAKPDWCIDPFVVQTKRRQARATPLHHIFKAFKALAQRGKGGVYQAVDLSATPPRFCVIKQGQRHGEVSWDGRDGRWRVKQEKRVLTSLQRRGISVPHVYSAFGSGKNYYLVVEFIEGETLDHWLRRRRRRLSIPAALQRSLEVAQLLARVHAAGWVWRDCKPANIIVAKGGELRPLDFEGACPINRPDPLPWSTPGFMAPEIKNSVGPRQWRPQDLYALGVIIYFLLAGRLPEERSLESMRKNVPEAVSELVAELLNSDPRRRPRAGVVVRRLKAALTALNHEGHSESFIRLASSAKRASCLSPSKIGSVVRYARVGSLSL